MNKQFLSRLALPFAVFGFMLIIATGFNMLLFSLQLVSDELPPVFSIMGLILIVIAMVIRKKAMI